MSCTTHKDVGKVEGKLAYFRGVSKLLSFQCKGRDTSGFTMPQLNTNNLNRDMGFRLIFLKKRKRCFEELQCG
jgi:hypothetical protein